MRRNYICDYPFTHFEVNNPNGDVTFCCNHQLVLGNVNRQSIAEIWNGPEYQRVRADFLSGRMMRYCHTSCPVLQGWKDYEQLDWYRHLSAQDPVRVNAELNEQEITAGRTELQSRPRWLRFATSYRCNLRCYHCYQEQQRIAALELPGRFMAEVGNMLPGLQVLFLYGGEPLLEESNIELLQHVAAQAGSTRLFLITNGTILNDRLRDMLQRINIGLLAISLDAATPERYEELRRPARWQQLQENLKEWAALAQRQGGRFHLAMTLNKRNADEMARFIDMCVNYRARPVFQLANNPCADPDFREKYEIHSPGERRAALRQVVAARDRAAAAGLNEVVVNLEILATELRPDPFRPLRALASFIRRRLPGACRARDNER